MASITKQKTGWRAQLYVKGVRDSAVFATKAEAQAWAVDRESQMRRVAKSGVDTEKTVQDAFDRYGASVSAQKKGKKWELIRLNFFARQKLGGRLFGSIPLCEVSSDALARWRDDRIAGADGRPGVQAATVNRDFNLLSHVFTMARKEWKWIAASPTTDVTRPKEGKPRFRRITEEEIEQICVALGWRNQAPKTTQQRVAATFLFAIETAMRAGEICALTKAEVTGRVARVLDAKNGEDRDVPLSPRALELWKMAGGDGFGVKPASVDAAFRKARDERTTIADLHFHDTRHEATTRLAKKLHVLALARVTGHKDIKQLMVYYNESAEDIADRL